MSVFDTPRMAARSMMAPTAFSADLSGNAKTRKTSNGPREALEYTYRPMLSVQPRHNWVAEERLETCHGWLDLIFVEWTPLLLLKTVDAGGDKVAVVRRKPAPGNSFLHNRWIWCRPTVTARDSMCNHAQTGLQGITSVRYLFCIGQTRPNPSFNTK